MSRVIMFVYHDYENDLLELRLNELSDIVYKFIIVEYPINFAFKPRTMYFNEHKHEERFKRFEDKIFHVIDRIEYPTNSGLGLLWLRRFSPVLMEALNRVGANDDDFIITVDSDVLLKREAFDGIDLSRQSSFRMNWYMYWFNFWCPHACFAWTISAPLWIIKAAGSPGKMAGYHHPGQEIQYIDDSGYHFGKTGGSKYISEHIMGYPHQEFNRPAYTDLDRIQERIDNGWGWTDCSRGTDPVNWNFEYMDYDPSKYPKYLNEHPEIFKKYFCFDKGAKNLGGGNWQ